MNTGLTIVTMIANTSVYYVPGTALTASETSTHTIVATASGGRDVADDETKCKARSLLRGKQDWNSSRRLPPNLSPIGCLWRKHPQNGSFSMVDDKDKKRDANDGKEVSKRCEGMGSRTHGRDGPGSERRTPPLRKEGSGRLVLSAHVLHADIRCFNVNTKDLTSSF